jgi:hypothetical protein
MQSMNPGWNDGRDRQIFKNNEKRPEERKRKLFMNVVIPKPMCSPLVWEQPRALALKWPSLLKIHSNRNLPYNIIVGFYTLS